MGRTKSKGNGDFDVYLIKTDADGNTLWEKTYGENNDDRGYSLQQTIDDGYIIAGVKKLGTGKYDIYLIKTDANGNTIWEKTYGETNDDWGISIRKTNDNGYIITGATYSTSSGSFDIYLLKIDENGDIIFKNLYENSGPDWGNNVEITQNGGFIIAGRMFTGNSADACLIKTDTNGNTVWVKTYGGSGDDEGIAVLETLDGGYIMVGQTNSIGAGYYDVYLIKTDVNGNTIWVKTYGGTAYDAGYYIANDINGYIIIGYTQSYGAGYYDVYLIKINKDGDILMEKTYGGSGDDKGIYVKPVMSGGYIITGFTNSYGAGNYDVYLIKTDSNGNSN